jgi:hypothetical protein
LSWSRCLLRMIQMNTLLRKLCMELLSLEIAHPHPSIRRP